MGLLPAFAPSHWRQTTMVLKEPPHEQGQDGALAGLAWAMTVVNMRSPEIMERLVRDHGRSFEKGRAFSNGVASAMIMRYDTSPDDPHIDAFRKHTPAGNDEEKALWRTLVQEPCDRAIDEWHPALKRAGRLGEIFRCQPLGELV